MTYQRIFVWIWAILCLPLTVSLSIYLRWQEIKASKDTIFTGQDLHFMNILSDIQTAFLQFPVHFGKNLHLPDFTLFGYGFTVYMWDMVMWSIFPAAIFYWLKKPKIVSFVMLLFLLYILFGRGMSIIGWHLREFPVFVR
jgi:hypothetical protein